MFGGFSGFSTSKAADAPSATAPETPTKQGTSGSLFGNTPTGGNLFGSASTSAGGGSGNLFGGSSTSTFSFGGAAAAAAAASKPAAASTGPSSTTVPTASSSFGSGSGNLFGSSTATSKPAATSSFGSGGGNLFGSSTVTSNPTATSSFGSGSGSLFGSSTATTRPAAPTSSFGTGGGSLFGSTAATLTSATKPSDAAGDKSDKASATTAGGFKLSTTPVVSEPPKGEEKKKETASDRADKLENATDLTNAALRGKTLEEIAQMWTTELAAQTRQFHSQANTVSYWDRALVQQGKRITELYEATMAVEEDQAGLDQSLDHMEGQQKALENLLDAYEGRVQGIVQKTMPRRATTGGALTADEEREHVYSSAERLNMQLDELARRLTTLVEDVNGISETQATDQGKEDRGADAFGQIVQILNSHLSSLEWVDSQTAQLQERARNAQKIYQEANAAQASLSDGVGNNTARTPVPGNNGEMVPPVTSSFGAPFGAGARKPSMF